VAAVILFPAIDLKDGQCVRLKQGEMSAATIFNADPAGQAESFAAQGFTWLHVVDLNGAFAGEPVNRDAVESILKTVDIPVQLGGGIRDMATIEAWLALGVRRVILGTAAVKNPKLVAEACRAFPARVAAAIDARNGKVAIEGWAETADIAAADLAKHLAGIGIAAIIHTDIDRDGLLRGLNIESTLALAREVDVPVIASGGLASIADIRRLLEPDCAILEGAIAGRSLYDGRLDAGEALKLIGMAA
jgi:phosphoribosylformimino-5-aminoimidazole carboxamide ribotide isomerase